MLISILNEKGGVGKTTLATNLGRAYQNRGRRVLLVDSDSQGSLRDWRAAAGDKYPTVIAMDKPAMIRDLPRMVGDYDLILIDGCPKGMALIAATVLVSDLVLIPVQPSGFDLWAANSVIDFVKQRREVTPGKPQAAFVMSRQITNTKLAGESRRALEEIGFQVLTGSTQRILYAVAAGEGKTVFDAEPNPAADEMEALANAAWELARG